jgi:PAS domain S-box-containing protein
MKKGFSLDLKTADNLGVGLFRYKVNSRKEFETVNSSLVEMLGYTSKDELCGKSWDELFVDAETKKRFLGLLSAKKQARFFEAEFWRKDAKRVWVALTAFQLGESTAVEYIEGMIEDISEHKATEEKVAIERDMFQGVLDNIPDAVYFKDVQNRLLKVNKFYLKGLGLSQEAIIGKTDFDFFPFEQARQMFEDDNYVLRTGRSIIGKIERTLLTNGTWNQVITTKIPMFDRSGAIIGTMGITRDMTIYAHLEQERFKMVTNALMVLGKILEMRDPYTFIHTRNVASIAEHIAKAMGWDENKQLGMRLAGEIHDLGKISIPLDILNKPGALNELEYQLIKKHVENCYNLIKDIEFPFSLNEIVYQHHERLDGSGYPRGLKDSQISVEARILAVSDVLESMTNHRPYRASLGIEKAIEELQAGAGVRYDDQVVNIVSRLVHQNNGAIFWDTN